MIGFNPRTHEGYDQIPAVAGYFPKRFNPRTHEGYDMW